MKHVDASDIADMTLSHVRALVACLEASDSGVPYTQSTCEHHIPLRQCEEMGLTTRRIVGRKWFWSLTDAGYAAAKAAILVAGDTPILRGDP